MYLWQLALHTAQHNCCVGPLDTLVHHHVFLNASELGSLQITKFVARQFEGGRSSPLLSIQFKIEERG
jgi:hypothetical protein